VTAVSPALIAWGLICAGVALRDVEVSQEENIWRQFPLFLLIAGVLILVSGRQLAAPRPLQTLCGFAVIVTYIVIWMFNARRSHALIGVLSGVCAWYLPRLRRPNVLIVLLTGLACAFAVSIALGWRSNSRYQPTPAGFLQYLSDFDPSSIL